MGLPAPSARLDAGGVPTLIPHASRQGSHTAATPRSLFFLMAARCSMTTRPGSRPSNPCDAIELEKMDSWTSDFPQALQLGRLYARFHNERADLRSPTPNLERRLLRGSCFKARRRT
jgi:hypothetical protein